MEQIIINLENFEGKTLRQLHKQVCYELSKIEVTCEKNRGKKKVKDKIKPFAGFNIGEVSEDVISSIKILSKTKSVEDDLCL